ncbi:hypothetical protein CMO83_02835 [Candidatus Woesearchaeota archaeon]|jgi:hypothetical protein|nr:hypothetical protein [Candidatus Woesearchaeota archaeon]|tara:strand:- start:2846 stop:3409 length:564 start_codon:yes stop_codon:yes gene_type:complete
MKPEEIIHFPEAPIHTVYLKFKGVMDMQDLYESIANFFLQKKFKLYEKQQRHRRPGPFGPEILHQFEATRKVEDYYEWVVTINIETFDMQDVEVVLKDGTKRKMTKGRIWVQLYGKVETDYEKLWEKSAFLAKLRSFYNKYVMRKRYEGVWWDELYYNIVLRLHAVIKERLKMTTEVFEHRHFSRTH